MITINARPLADPAPVLQRNLAAGITEALLLLERGIKPKIPIGVTEAGRGSLAWELRSAGTGMPVGVIGSPLKHVAVLNDGRRPGQKPPPSEALELWVRRKVRIEKVHETGSKAGQVKTRKGQVVVRQPTEKEARSIAFLIARAIGRRGIEGQFFFEAAISQNAAALETVFGEMGMGIAVDLTRGG